MPINLRLENGDTKDIFDDFNEETGVLRAAPVLNLIQSHASDLLDLWKRNCANKNAGANAIFLDQDSALFGEFWPRGDISAMVKYIHVGNRSIPVEESAKDRAECIFCFREPEGRQQLCTKIELRPDHHFTYEYVKSPEMIF
mmetsp:Transcript_45666/g.74470  ORF Transcript_45666/g.74470 Transcript_45666/m.74470 type:complete len:142 (+) Transcript_45666:126-551(+)